MMKQAHDSRRRFGLAALSLVLPFTLALPGQARAVESVFVVVSARSLIREIGPKELLALYTGRSRTGPGGEAATPLDQARDGSTRAKFYQALAGADLATINRYWARLHFTGQVQPPPALAGDAEVVQRLRHDPNAIGYLSRAPQDTTLRVLMQLP